MPLRYLLRSRCWVPVVVGAFCYRMITLFALLIVVLHLGAGCCVELLLRCLCVVVGARFGTASTRCWLLPSAYR